MTRPIAIFDLDGTLADASHRIPYIDGSMGKKDWDAFFLACDDDKPIWPMINTALGLHQCGYSIWIMTGRSEIAEAQTLAWLHKYAVHFDTLVMRSKRDYRPDHELKRSWVTTRKSFPKDQVKVVFEDRLRVVEMWRKEGFFTVQVGHTDGDF